MEKDSTNKKEQQISIKLPVDIAEKLKSIAEGNWSSRSKLIVRVLTEFAELEHEAMIAGGKSSMIGVIYKQEQSTEEPVKEIVPEPLQEESSHDKALSNMFSKKTPKIKNQL